LQSSLLTCPSQVIIKLRNGQQALRSISTGKL